MVAVLTDHQGLAAAGCHLLPLSRMIASVVSAFRMSRTYFMLSLRNHLPHFAMWTAFPASDSYWGSVAIGLAPRRQS
jgi:hypothetical protein